MSWRQRAACVGMDSDLWFPPVTATAGTAKSERAYRTRGSEAIAICSSCPMRHTCLTDALSYPWSDDACGIRAGLTPGERNLLRVV